MSRAEHAAGRTADGSSLIDLRSDTVTRPTPAMRRAMADAAVGDDVYAEDPTVNLLQDMLAERAGFQAGLLMPTGTMSNLAAMLAHAGRGSEVIVPAGAHVYDWELGGMAVVGGLLPREVPAPRGVPAVEDIRSAIRRSVHAAPPGLIVLENTHNMAGGTVVPVDTCHGVGELARAEGLPLHLDGARAFNAAVALGVSLATLCAPFDSASLCLSKGLGAPVGTVLVGSRELVDRAHRYRKILGGGMRQAGVIAAAGIVAVEQMFERLADDHARARRLAEQLQGMEGLELDLDRVETNMVYLDVARAADVVAALREEGVLVNAMGPARLRLVTHHHIRDEDIAATVAAFERVLDRRLAA